MKRPILRAKLAVSLLLLSAVFASPALARVPVATPLELRGDGGDPRAIEPSAVGGDLYFAADLGDGAGREAVRYRSSDNTVVRLGDIHSGVGDSDPYSFVAVPGGVLFRAHPTGSAADGRLYRYDGTTVSEVLVQGGGSAINPSAITFAADGGGAIVYLIATVGGEQRVLRYDAGSNVVVPLAGLEEANCASPRSLIALKSADSAALLCDHPHSDGPTRPTLVLLDGATATFVEEMERSNDDTLVRPVWTDRLVSASNSGSLVAGVADFGRGQERVLISLSGGTYYAALGASADTVAFVTGVDGYGGADILANLAFSAVQLALAPAVNGNDLVVSALSLANGSAFEAVHAGSELAISFAPASARQNREPVVYQGGALSAPIVTDLVAGTSDGSDPADFARGDSFFLFSADEGAGVRRVGYIDLDDESAGYLTPAAGVGTQPISFRTFANGRVAFSALNGVNRTIYVTDVAAVCGDGLVEGSETCDDGAANGTPNNCNASCDGTTAPVCGNSVVEAGEDCDTGGQSATCEADCSVPQCGDGVVNNAAGETCDDGADNGSPNNCNASCDGTTAPVCGNSVVEAGEDCDTGGQSATCEADCSIPQCGDGVVNIAAGETCDDGASNGTPLNCSASCDGTTAPVCGNSVVEAGETCDDGADNGSPNNCNASCDGTTAPVCGNSVVEAGETCDDGADNGTPNSCNASCDGTTTPVCGNDVVEAGETCDDGGHNGTANNCNESCDGITGSVCGNSVVEAGEDCDTGGQSATCEADCSDPVCGDGVVNNAAGETCDDGADNGTPNSCNASCDGTTAPVCGNSVVEAGETCDDGADNGTPNSCNASCDGTTTPVCGNDVIEAGETCDDGSDNGTPNNCNTSCDGTTEPVCGNDVIEAGETCDDGSDNGTPNNCNTTCDGTTEPVCGNGVQEEGEACDDANDSNDDDCTNTCLLPGCGDGITGGDEECDDGNVLDADGCSLLCEIEEGWDCTLVEDVPDTACEPIDGDGIVVGDEQCDDGNTDAGDGCSGGEVEEGWNCDNASPSSCSLDAFCGDGIVQAGESCDDGNDEAGDGCDANCDVESGYICDDASPTTCLPDADNDGVADDDDNCPETANGDQSDEDNDGVGDACDEPGVPGEDNVNFSGGRGFGSCATSSTPSWPLAALFALALVAICRRQR